MSDLPELVADNFNRRDIPSMVNFSHRKGDLIVSVDNTAKKRKNNNSTMTIYDTKLMLGKRFESDFIQKMKEKWLFAIIKGDSDEVLISLDGIERKYKPYEISGEILKHLVETANKMFPPEKKTNKVVITIPANFGDEQRSETMKAAEYVGLNVLTLINEPTAAGLAFGLQDQNTKPKYVFVFDFGGGTLDVSLLYIEKNEINVKATDGDMFLGGRYFDENTLEFLKNELELEEAFCQNQKKMSRLLEMITDAKKELSTQISATIVPDDDNDFEEYELTLEKFEEINSNLIDRIIEPVKRLLSNAKVDKSLIDLIILVGGSSNMKFVREKLTSFFGKEPYNGVNPREAVALGAGIVAAKSIEYLNQSNKIRKLQYHDISQFSIGTSNNDGTMAVLIPKNQPIPYTKTETFQTLLYRQESFTVDIYEGESKNVADNLKLAEFTVSGLPISENYIYFTITFSLDENGILSASAKLKDSDVGAERQIQTKKLKATSKNDDENDGNLSH